MTRLLATASTVSLCLLLGACGSEAQIDATPFEVRLHALDVSPGCYVEPQTTTSMAGTGSMLRQSLWMQLQLAVQRAELLLAPVREAPAQSEWALNPEPGVRIEGRALAQGDDWGALTMVLIFEDADYSLHADIDYDPVRTTVDLGSEDVLRQSDNAIRFGALAVGCDPATGWSFIGADSSWDCWNAEGFRPGVDDAEPSDDPRVAAELAMSANMQCMQLATRVP